MQTPPHATSVVGGTRPRVIGTVLAVSVLVGVNWAVLFGLELFTLAGGVTHWVPRVCLPALAAAAVWWRVVARRKQSVSVVRGAVAGLAACVLYHACFWLYMYYLSLRVTLEAWTGFPGLARSFVLTTESTALFWGVVGAFMGRLQASLVRASNKT